MPGPGGHETGPGGGGGSFWDWLFGREHRRAEQARPSECGPRHRAFAEWHAERTFAADCSKSWDEIFAEHAAEDKRMKAMG